MKLTGKKLKAYEADRLLLAEFLARVGAKSIPDTLFAKWEVATIFGPLRVSLSEGLNFVAARFEEVGSDRTPPGIEQLPARDQLNTWSGKWNCCVAKNGRLDRHESILAFCDRVERILPQKLITVNNDGPPSKYYDNLPLRFRYFGDRSHAVWLAREEVQLHSMHPCLITEPVRGFEDQLNKHIHLNYARLIKAGVLRSDVTRGGNYDARLCAAVTALTFLERSQITDPTFVKLCDMLLDFRLSTVPWPNLFDQP